MPLPGRGAPPRGWMRKLRIIQNWGTEFPKTVTILQRSQLAVWERNKTKNLWNQSKGAGEGFKLFREDLLSHKEAKLSREIWSRLIAARNGVIGTRGEFKPVWVLFHVLFLACVFLLAFFIFVWCFFVFVVIYLFGFVSWSFLRDVGVFLRLGCLWLRGSFAKPILLSFRRSHLRIYYWKPRVSHSQYTLG